MGRQRRQQLLNDIGHTGLEVRYGRIEDDFLKEWNGREKVKRVDQMLRNSPVIGALRLAFEMPIKDIEWQFVSDEGEDDPRLALLNDSLSMMSHSIEEHVSDALLFPFYGWSMFTITYQRVGSRFYWRKFKELGHDTIQHWMFEEDGTLSGLQQWSYLYASPIPIERMIIYRARRNRGNPEGESLLRPAWIPFYYATNLQEIEAIGIERNVAGLPVVTLPETADTSESTDENTDYGRAAKIARNIRNDEQGGVVKPYGWELELLSATGGSKTVDTNMVISRYEKRILMSTLAQFLMLGMDNVGAMATFDGGSGFFTSAVNSIADTIADTFTAYAIPRLMRLNGMGEGGLRLHHSPAGNIDLDQLGRFLQIVSPALTLTPADEVWLRSLTRMPEMSTDEIAAAQEAEREARLANIPPALRQNAVGAAEVDENAAKFFAADDAPDRRQRQRLERDWNETAVNFFTKQKRRIERGAKELG